jgi:class 3 adenylate cyclase
LSLFRNPGPRTRRLSAFLGRRSAAARSRREQLDERAAAGLVRPRAIVFTDTDDFTHLVARFGILHFLMLFDEAVAATAPEVAKHGGELVKVEGDSLLLRFERASDAARAVLAMERVLLRRRKGRGAGEALAFSYGIGFGDVIDLEHDVFGLEVNIASKLGEDRARAGEILLTPGAAAALPKALAAKTRFHSIAMFEGRPLRIRRLKA